MQHEGSICPCIYKPPLQVTVVQKPQHMCINNSILPIFPLLKSTEKLRIEGVLPG
uniref:Uncharacterized protein n=1 Tax=Manihot esculenta TaxID=3983 RepID=A0A2C9WHC4_MANES